MLALPGVKGVLRVSRYGVAENSATPMRHVSVYVPGLAYQGMEDNDIRGMLDGTFRWAWNQPGQIHVRLGRLSVKEPPSRPPKYGEPELLRVLQRWDGIHLPPLARVTQARLILKVEKPPASPLRVMLYPVHTDWDPGTGGTQYDNTSPPKTGEVWWNEVGYGKAAWGLPGAGFASRDHRDADTDVMPLADALYQPEDSELVLSSPQLAAYATERITERLPLLFLLKLSDLQEDVPGMVLPLYSANHGDSRNFGRRPRLVLEWESSAEKDVQEEWVFLEHGRSFSPPRISTRDCDSVAVTFFPENDSEMPTIEIREGSAGGASDGGASNWTRAGSLIRPQGDWLELRVSAAHDPVPLGTAFEATLRDTWVLSGPPESQDVTWHFLSPTGNRHTIAAEYRDGFTWGIHFVPDEPGPWQYRWEQRFLDEPYVSATGHFDVLARDRQSVLTYLERITSEIEAAAASSPAEIPPQLRIRFSRLERAGVGLETPESFRSAPGEELRRGVDAARSALRGRSDAGSDPDGSPSTPGGPAPDPSEPALPRHGESDCQSQSADDTSDDCAPTVNETTTSPPTLRIEPSRGWVSLKLHELWEYRELLYFLTWRDIKVRYKQTVLGAAWAIIQPFFTMVVFSLFFGKLAQVPSDGVPYPIFSFAALVPWTFFANGLGQSANSLVGSANMIKKVYFPRLAVPLATIVAGAVDFVLAFVVLLAMMAFYGIVPTANVIWLPLLLLLAFITALGAGLWLSALNVQFRDVRFTIPFLTQFWLFATPIAYPSSLLDEPWRTLYGINPMVGVVEGFRWALLGTDTAPGPIIAVSSLAAIGLLLSGAYFFRRMERSFADVV